MRNFDQIELFRGVDPVRATGFHDRDLETTGRIATAESSDLARGAGMGRKLATEIRRTANRLVGRSEEFTPEDNVRQSTSVDGPVSAFRVEPRTAAAEETIRLDAGPSRGEIERFAWDFDFDGAFSPDIESEADHATHAYETAGDREIALRVVDADGQTDLTSKRLSIGELSDGSVLRFILADGYETENRHLRRSNAGNQSFIAETSLDPGTEVDVRLTDYPGGVPFDVTTESVDSDGVLEGAFDFRGFEQGTYFFEARRNDVFLGRVTVALFEVPPIR